MMIHSTRGLKLLIAFLLAITVLFIMLEMEEATVSGKTITVDDDGPADYDNIQEAIDNAAEGDTIEVAAGLYSESIDVDKGLVLVGEGSSITTIDGGGDGDVVDISADGVSISGFTITGGNYQESGVGISSNNNRLWDNILTANYFGIRMLYSKYNVIWDNTISENGIGVEFEYADNNNLSYNTLSDNIAFAVQFKNSGNNVLKGNTMTNCGLMFDKGTFQQMTSYIIDTENTVNGKPVYYYTNESGITVPSGAGQVLLANCTDMIVKDQNCSSASFGTQVGYSSNITIIDNIFTNNWVGINLYDCDESTISGNNCSDNEYGMWMDFDCDNNTFSENICSNNDEDGLYFNRSDNNTIEKNSCESNSGNGILLESSHHNEILNNRIAGNLVGVKMSTSNNNTLSLNTIEENRNQGISLMGDLSASISGNIIDTNECSRNGGGVYMIYAQKNTISSNTINENEGTGIFLTSFGWFTPPHTASIYSSDNNSIYRNSISTNDGHGIFLAGCSNNSMENNSIVGNTDGIHLKYHKVFTGDDPVLFSSRNNIAHNNNIVDNEKNGINATDNEKASINATDNWWGDDSGPYHEIDNPTGTGDNVTDYVEFDPWLEDPILLAVIVSISPNPTDDEGDIWFEGFGIGEVINKYAWSSSIDGEFYNGTQSRFYNSGILSIGTHTLYFNVRQRAGNIWSEKVNTTLLVHDRPMPTIEEISPKDALDTDDILFRGSGTDDGTIEGYAWRSNKDGEFYNGTEAEFTYDGLSNGSHIVYLKVMDNYGSWSDDIPDTLKIQGRPVGHIDSISPNPALLGDNVTIKGHGTDDGSIRRIIWNSSIDGILDDGMNETIWRDDLLQGEHIISIVVVDDKDVWSYEVTMTLIITLKPEAFIDTIIPDPALDTDLVHFEGHGVDGDGTIVQYEWRSDVDEDLYSGPEPQFDDADLSNGTHTIFFRVRDNYGIWSDEVNRTIIVYGQPRARIASIDPDPAVIGEEVFFRGTWTDDGVIERYAWISSIDGEFYNGTESEFFFANLSLGTHTIFFKVRDNDGIWSDEVSRSLIITLIPNATIEDIDPSPAFDTDTITFNGSGSDDGSIEQYAWKSSIDGEFYNDTLPVFEYFGLTNGTHAIFFKVKDDLGFWSEEVNVTLIIYGRPRAKIDSIKPRPASPDDNITFRGSGSDDGSVVRYLWRSSIQGELYNGTDSTFNATTFLRGHHTIFFRVRDDDGFWSEEVTTLLIISDIPVAAIDSISPNPALHVDTIYLEGHGTDNGNIERYVWRSDVDGEFYNGTQGNITPFNIFESFEDVNLTYDTGGYVNWFTTNSTGHDGVQCAMSGDIDDDEFTWMEASFDWPGTLEFSWKVSSEDEDYLKLYVDGKLKARISGEMEWTRYSISFDEGGHTVRWSYEKDTSVSFGEDTGYVDAVNYTSSQRLANGTHTIYFRVMDNEGFWSNEKSAGLVINGKPIVLQAEINPNPAFHNDLITFNASVLDDGNITRYVWWSTRGGELYNGTSPVFVMTGLENGTHVITLMVQDDIGTWSDAADVNLSVRGKPFAYIDNITPNPALDNEIVNFNGHGTPDGKIITYVWRSSIGGEFYNGTESQINVTSLSNGTHTIFFRVRDNRGYWSDEVNTTLDINGIPTASIISVLPNLAVDTEDVTFRGFANDDGVVDRFVWRSSLDGVFYDGDQSVIALDTLSPGFHRVYLKVQDDKGIWSQEVSSTLNITERPVAFIDFINPNPAVHTDRIFFRGHGEDDGVIVWYEWKSDKHGTIYYGNATEFNSTTLRNGTHVIDFRVRDNYNFWSEWVTLPLDINGIPQAIISSFDPAQPTDLDTVNFYGSEIEDGTIEEYAWRSSLDGFLSDEKSFSISNLRNGTHLIYLKVRDNKGLWSEEVGVIVRINGYPVAKIGGIVPNKANEGTIVWFYGNASDDVEIVENQWLSDKQGIISIEESFTMDSLENGTHQITFRARDNNNLWSDDAFATLTINGIPRAHIIEITPEFANEGALISFSGNGTDDKGAIKDYSWRSDLVPGLLSTEKSFSTSDLPNGTHLISFKVKDQDNKWSDEVFMSITINGIPIANIREVTPDPGVVTRKITFKGNGSDDGGTIWDYAWRSSIDGNLNSLSSFSRTDLSVGIHTIYFKVKDNRNVWSPELSTTLTVNPLPRAIIINIIPSSSNSGDAVSFHGRGEVDNATIVDFYWESSLNGKLSNKSVFSHSGLWNGSHEITLKVLDDKGIWSDAASKTISVNGLPTAEITNISEVGIIEGDMVSFTGAGIDEGTIQQYEWKSSLEGELYSGGDSHFEKSLHENGVHIITLRVQDNLGAWSQVVSTELWVNGIPTAAIDHISKSPAEEGISIFFRADGQDDNSVVKYIWESSLDGILYDGPDPEFRTSSLSIGNHTITLKVQDNEGVWSNTDIAIVIIKEKKDSGMPWMMYLAAGGVVMIVILGLLFGVILPKGKAGSAQFQQQPIPSQGQQQSIPQQPQQQSVSPQGQQQSIPPQAQQQPFPQPPAQQAIPGQPPAAPRYPPAPQQPIPTSQAPQPMAPVIPLPGTPPQAPAQTATPPGPQPSSTQQPGAAGTGTGQPLDHWICPKCGNKPDQKFIFCTKCGYKR